MSQRRVRYGGPKTPRQKKTELPDTLNIERLSIEGRGVSRVNGKTIFVAGALPGEEVRATLTKPGKRFDEATTLEVVTSSPNRITPACEYYEQCGGCDQQHLTSDTAISSKEVQILEILKRQSQIEPDSVAPPLRSEKLWEYRRSARVGINQRDNGDLIIGFRRAGSHKLINIERCPVLTPRCNDFLAALRLSLGNEPRIKLFTHIELTDGDELLSVDIRCNKHPSDHLIKKLIALGQSQNINLRLTMGDQIHPIHHVDVPSYDLNQGDLTLDFDTRDFLQINAQVNQQLIDTALSWLAPKLDDHMLDLFSGLGNFSLPFAQRCKSVTAVEGSRNMVERTQHNAKKNNITNITALSSDLSSIDSDTPWLKVKYDIILLDPPRTGASDIIPHLSKQQPRALLYIACDPMSLVRDSQLLKTQGYKMTRFQVADMFPQTHHVESLALFERSR